MSDLEKALAKLESENIKHGSPEEQVREMVRLWCQVEERAVELVLAEDKTCAGAYDAMYKYAQQHKSTPSSAYVSPDQAMAIVMEYFGAGTMDEAHSQLEAGLMARIMQKQLEKWSTYVPGELKTQPVAEAAPASEPKTSKPAFDLSDLSLEDEL